MNEIEKAYYSDDGLVSNSFLKAVLGGPNKIKAFFERLGKKTKKKHYILGGAVDKLLTNFEEFKEDYIKADFALPSPKVSEMTELLISAHGDKSSVEQYPDYIIHQLCVECNWYADEKFKHSRVKKFINEAGFYYKKLLENQDKYILSVDEYNSVKDLANLIRTHEYTSPFFNLDKIEGFKVGKSVRIDWTSGASGTMIRCKSLLDRLIINTTDENYTLDNGFVFPAKTIIPFDYKTMYGNIHDFIDKSFNPYRYDFQGAFYYAACNFLAQKIKASRKEDLRVVPPVFIVGSFSDSYPVWYQMTMDDLQKGRLGDGEDKGYYEAIRLYEQYKNSGQWDIPPHIFYNKGNLSTHENRKTS